jgi:hypothetical protein
VDREQRVERLREAAATRSADAIARAHRAVTTLVARGGTVTFASVAAEAHVSESFPCKHSELRDRIAAARRKARSSHDAASAASLRVQLDVVIDRLNKTNARNALLAKENETLRGEVSDLRARLRRLAASP